MALGFSCLPKRVFARILLRLNKQIQAKRLSTDKIRKPVRAASQSQCGFRVLFGTKKMNHAMNNYSQKFASTSYEVKTPLDSNKEIFPTNFQPPARSAARCLS